MSFVFYETCTPLVLFGYAFFWPIVGIVSVSCMFFQVYTVATTFVGVAMTSVAFLYTRALMTQK